MTTKTETLANSTSHVEQCGKKLLATPKNGKSKTY